MNDRDGSKFDFNEVESFARPYLETYYIWIGEDEPVISKFLIEKGKKLGLNNLEALEIGCGPTVHHGLSIAPYVKTLDMSDYLQDNLNEVKKWKEGKEDFFSWNHYTKMVLENEGMIASEDAILRHENVLRSKIGNFYHCDVTKNPVIENGKTYPVVLTFYCSEEVGITIPEWKKVMKNISDMVSPGGYFFISTLRDISRYILGDANGKHEWLPCANISEKILRDCLIELGYEEESIDIVSVDTPAQTAETGIVGALMSVAKKKAHV